MGKLLDERVVTMMKELREGSNLEVSQLRDCLREVKDRAAWRISELENSRKAARAAQDQADREAARMFIEREKHMAQLRKSFRRLRGSLETAGIKTGSDPAKADLSVGHITHELGAIADRLGNLQASIDAVLELEGWELAARVVEYVLMSFRSQDPRFDPEPARTRPVGP